MSQSSTAANGSPRTVEAARRAVESSREQMSGTLDQIEHRIVMKKHEISHRMDVARPVREQVRERPLIAVGIAFAAGLILWKLRHHDEDDEWEDEADDAEYEEDEVDEGPGLLDRLLARADDWKKSKPVRKLRSLRH